MRYRDFIITYDPKPIPDRSFDWCYVHDSYDGMPEDKRHGDCRSREACIAEIDEWYAEQELD